MHCFFAQTLFMPLVESVGQILVSRTVTGSKIPDISWRSFALIPIAGKSYLTYQFHRSDPVLSYIVAKFGWPAKHLRRSLCLILEQILIESLK